MTYSSGNTNDPNKDPYISITGDYHLDPSSIEPGGLKPVSSTTHTYKNSYCKNCGTSNQMWVSYPIGDDLCPQCLKEVFDGFWEIFFEKKKLYSNPEYCNDCKSHCNACHCPKRERLRKLKK